MITCFLFIEQLEQQTIESICFDAADHIVEPLEDRSVEELQSISQRGRTVIVLSTDMVSIHQVELPKLDQRNMRSAIAYMLEETLAQDVDKLHIAYDKRFKQDDAYIVSVIDKQWLATLLQWLNAQMITVNAITIDWFALDNNQACITPKGLLLRTPAFNGALREEFAHIYSQNVFLEQTHLGFIDSHPSLAASVQSISIPFHTWVAQSLLTKPYMNLYQGSFQPQIKNKQRRWWYWVCAGTIGIWLALLLATDIYNLYQEKQKLRAVEQRIASIYRKIFPNAQHVISPRFRVEQALRRMNKTQIPVFWSLLEKLASALHIYAFNISSMTFHQKTLQIVINTEDFAMLKDIEQHLTSLGVKVRQVKAYSQHNEVIATLEIS